jgi:hypothetical protein
MPISTPIYISMLLHSCTCSHMHACMPAYIHNICGCMHNIFICMNTYIHVHACIYTYIHMHTSILTCKHMYVLCMHICVHVYMHFLRYFIVLGRGWARTQTPTTRNCTVELPTFAVIARVSQVKVQWNGLVLGDTPHWSDMLPRQVSMQLPAAIGGWIWVLSHNLWRVSKRSI